MKRGQAVFDQEAGWRRRVAAAFREREYEVRALEADNCLRFWWDGHPQFACRRYRYCLNCLRFRLKKLRREDAVRLTQARVVEVLHVESSVGRCPRNTPWRRAVQGFRKLYLPNRVRWSWIVVTTNRAAVERLLEARGRFVSCAALDARYEAPIAELIQLGPEKAVASALASPRLRQFDAAGVFRRRVEPGKAPRGLAGTRRAIRVR